ncbi:MAG: BON domain-containing protein [Planctomycetaceae bacterium]|jgi:hypothetical protein|nr:BON domain-containing protein [Planctomycetaceae bacterium]
MLRFYFYPIIFFLTMSVVVIAQETAAEAEQPTELGLLGSEVQTRLGKVRFGEIPDTIQFDHPRFYNDFKMGNFNTWLAVEPNAPNFRFRSIPRSIPQQQSPQSQHLSDVLSAKKTNKHIVSANIPVLADTSANSSTQPVRRLPGFFERSGVMDAAELQELSEERPIRSSTGSRWFRDIDRNNDNNSELPTLNQRSRNQRSPQNSGGNNYFSGNAVTVGGELLQDQQTSQQTPQSIPQSQVSATETNLRTFPVDSQSAAKNQFESLRRFEQKLEGMLLSDPLIHFLSPVRVSFRNGVVSVRGIVPSKEHKIAAGNLLLKDPLVKQVNNLISIVPTDPTQIPPPIEPK